MNAATKHFSQGLKSELARLCLPGAARDPNRNLAWVNSICIVFLLIGILGSRPGSIKIRPPPPIEEIVPAIVEPLPPPPTRIEAQQNPEPTEQPKPEAAVVVVTPETPQINFSVPTIGQLVVPNAIAAAPPAEPLKPPTPVRNEPRTITNTGKGGDRPAPDYPKMAQELHQQGTVVLLVTADEHGLITNIQVSQSSGSGILDHGALEYVKRHWILPPGATGQIYEAPIHYTLTE